MSDINENEDLTLGDFHQILSLDHNEELSIDSSMFVEFGGRAQFLVKLQAWRAERPTLTPIYIIEREDEIILSKTDVRN